MIDSQIYDLLWKNWTYMQRVLIQWFHILVLACTKAWLYVYMYIFQKLQKQIYTRFQIWWTDSADLNPRLSSGKVE